MQVAIEKKVPLIFWGEPSAEYTSYYGYEDQEFVDEERFNRYANPEDNCGRYVYQVGWKGGQKRFESFSVSRAQGS